MSHIISLYLMHTTEAREISQHEKALSAIFGQLLLVSVYKKLKEGLERAVHCRT